MSRWDKIGAWVFGLFLFGGLFFLIYSSIYNPPVYDDTAYIEEDEEYEEEEDEDAAAETEEEPAAPAPAAPATKK